MGTFTHPFFRGMVVLRGSIEGCRHTCAERDRERGTLGSYTLTKGLYLLLCDTGTDTGTASSSGSGRGNLDTAAWLRKYNLGIRRCDDPELGGGGGGGGDERIGWFSFKLQRWVRLVHIALELKRWVCRPRWSAWRCAG